MRLRHLKDAQERIENSKELLEDGTLYKGHWRDTYFKNNHDLFIEVGMGKGQFLKTHAEENPKANFIGFEKYEKVMVRALDKFEDMPNVALLCTDACGVEEIFAEDEISGIYLNFSDPWPKDRHSPRRLTHGNFLDRYKNILDPKGFLCFKTDNENLYDFSLEQLEEKKWRIIESSRDLHKSNMTEGNVMTEYEQRYNDQGLPIYYVKALPPAEEK